jgi:hypothetical protein
MFALKLNVIFPIPMSLVQLVETLHCIYKDHIQTSDIPLTHFKGEISNH